MTIDTLKPERRTIKGKHVVLLSESDYHGTGTQSGLVGTPVA